jgi:hypothetical protein
MRNPYCRPFLVLDGMILIAGLAVAMSVARAGGGPNVRRGDWSVARVRAFVQGPAALFAAAMAPSVIAVRLRGPRPSRSRLMCQPGAVAACVVVVGVSVGALAWAVSGSRPPPPPLRTSFTPLGLYWRTYRELISPAVVGAWLSLWLGGRWRPERGWIDGLGRLLGGFWVANLLFEWPLGNWTTELLGLVLPRR